MPYFYPPRFVLSVCMLVAGVGFSSPSMATSKGYNAPAQVILKDGVPCFFAAMPSDKPTAVGQTLTVVNNRDATKPEWRIDEKQGIEPLPSSAERCVKYGASWRTGVTVTAPAQLQYGVPYYADIETGIGTGTRFRVEFCLSQDAHGEPFLAEWAEDGNHCAGKPLNDTDRPSVWKRMFGK